MLMQQHVLEGIKAGEITLVYRRWSQPRIKQSSTLKTAVGILEVQAISEIQEKDISESDVQQTEYPDKETLLRDVNQHEGNLYRIELTYVSEDPRIALRQDDDLSDSDIAELTKKLQRFDTYSRVGDWTYSLLEAIEQYPMLSAGDLAEKTEFEKEWLKRNVRKLKNLGLTESHNPGYKLSPRGVAFFDKLKNED